MKQGKSIVELAQEIERRAEAQRDFLVPAQEVQMITEAKTVNDEIVRVPRIAFGDNAFDITQHTHRQLGTYTGIPAKYYDKALNSDPGLLMMNVNHWLRQAGGEKRMIRTLDNNARAWLSDRYRRLDNIEIADALMPKILESKDIVLASADVTDSKLYIKAVFPSVRAEVKVGDVVEAGVIIQNSEIGMGALSGSLFINRLKCTNGMVVNDLGMRRNHVGSRLDVEGDGMYKLYSDKTIKLDNEAVISKLMDIVDAASTKENFERAVELMRESAKSEEMKDPEEGIVELAKIIGLNEGEAKQARRNLQEGRDYTRWGALNAVTALANDHESYDRATEIEELGGKVLNLSRSQWRTVVEAA